MSSNARLSMNLRPKDRERIEGLLESTDHDDITSVVRAALQYYARAVSIVAEGGQLRMIDGAGDEYRLELMEVREKSGAEPGPRP